MPVLIDVTAVTEVTEVTAYQTLLNRDPFQTALTPRPPRAPLAHLAHLVHPSPAEGGDDPTGRTVSSEGGGAFSPTADAAARGRARADDPTVEWVRVEDANRWAIIDVL